MEYPYTSLVKLLCLQLNNKSKACTAFTNFLYKHRWYDPRILLKITPFIYISQYDFLIQACQVGDLLTIKQIVRKRGLHKLRSKAYPIGIACMNGYISIVKYLVEEVGVNIHIGDDYPLFCACHIIGKVGVIKYSEKHLEIAKYLIEAGANIHHNNNEIFRWSCMDGNLPVIKWLVETIELREGMDGVIDMICSDKTGLQWALRQEYLHIIKYLVEKVSESKQDEYINSMIHYDDDTPLRDACELGYLEIVKYLVDVGANIHVNNDEPLRLASVNNHPDIVQFLTQFRT